jgi:hypothetical protein
MASVEEACLRWTTILWKQSRPDGGRFALQMRQNPLDYRWVFNAGDDLDLTGTALAGLDIDVEHSFEPLHPGHRHMALRRRLVLPAFPGGLTPLAPPSPPRRRNTHTKLAIGGEMPEMCGNAVRWALWRQGAEHPELRVSASKRLANFVEKSLRIRLCVRTVRCFFQSDR